MKRKVGFREKEKPSEPLRFKLVEAGFENFETSPSDCFSKKLFPKRR